MDESRAMARFAYYGITTPADEAEAAIMELSPAQLSGLVDLVTAQIEYHRDEIVRLRPILRRLQERVPDDYNNLMNQVKQLLNELD